MSKSLHYIHLFLTALRRHAEQFDQVTEKPYRDFSSSRASGRQHFQRFS